MFLVVRVMLLAGLCVPSSVELLFFLLCAVFTGGSMKQTVLQLFLFLQIADKSRPSHIVNFFAGNNPDPVRKGQ